MEKSCVESCKPTYNLSGQISSGTMTTACCQGDLCNEKLHSRAPAHALRSHALGLVLALSLLALIVAPSL